MNRDWLRSADEICGLVCIVILLFKCVFTVMLLTGYMLAVIISASYLIGVGGIRRVAPALLFQ